MWNKEKLLFLLPFAYAYALLFFLIKKKFFFFILFFFFFVSSLCRLVCSAVCQGVCARVLRSGCEMPGFHSVWYVFRVCVMRVSHCAVRCAACVVTYRRHQPFEVAYLSQMGAENKYWRKAHVVRAIRQ